MAAKAWIDAFLLIEANDNEWKIPFLFRSDFFEIIETSMEEVFFAQKFFFLKWISESEDKKPFCRSFKETEIFWQKVSIHSRIKESWIFYLNISFVRRRRVLNGMVMQSFCYLIKTMKPFSILIICSHGAASLWNRLRKLHPVHLLLNYPA